MDMHAAGAQVARQQTQVLAGSSLEQRTAGPARECRVVAEFARPARLEDLQRAVDRVATEHQTLVSAGRELEADLAGRMAGQRQNAAAVDDLVAGLDGLEQSALDHRQDAVLEASV